MNIVFFSHPDFLSHQSMPRFTAMLAEGMKARGHHIEVWRPRPVFLNLLKQGSLRKWLGYADQYILFPRQVRKRLKQYSTDTLFVFTDHALGPWVPLVKTRPHIIHCHDFLAQRSALGELPENPTGFSGRQYQAFIRRGYSQGQNFISVSNKTNDDLKRFLSESPDLAKVVYNGLNQSFTAGDPDEARKLLSKNIAPDISRGYLLHVGGNHWYKNRSGVLEIYNAWRRMSSQKLPLLMIGEPPTDALLHQINTFSVAEDIHFLSHMPDEQVRLAYQGATIFLFPSLEEGFGWPIAEAMASGCPVITTAEAPMTEVAGNAGFLIPRMPQNLHHVIAWANEASYLVERIINLSATEREGIVKAGLDNAARFNSEDALNRIEEVYRQVASHYKQAEW